MRSRKTPQLAVETSTRTLSRRVADVRDWVSLTKNCGGDSTRNHTFGQLLRHYRTCRDDALLTHVGEHNRGGTHPAIAANGNPSEIPRLHTDRNIQAVSSVCIGTAWDLNGWCQQHVVLQCY